mgnify:CR=1 FL=1
MTAHNPRLHAFRPDLADIRLKGEVSAERFVSGSAAQIAVPVSDMKRLPAHDAGLDTQLLLGDAVQVYDRANGWAWVQAERDGYVGYVSESDLTGPVKPATHVVIEPRSFVYPGPDLRFPVVETVSMGSGVRATGEAETRGTRYLLLDHGAAMIANHLAPVVEHASDYVAVAERPVNTPYLWGGNTGFGIDCSGLVQLALRMSGVNVLRDSDMQEATIGAPLDPGLNHQNVQRGDLVFWKGHVAIMTDAEMMIHANGHTMLVSRERLDDAVKRIGYLYGQPTGFRRL